MTTLPSGEPDSTENRPHRAREIAESFGVDAERYDRARPRYPRPLIERIAAESPGPDLLVVGSGTGIDARQFQAVGCRVTGVEPDARMAEFARTSGVPTEVATFEDWESGGRTFDTVAAGMAWHWVDPVAGAAKASELLRPGGRLALFWYVFQPPPDLGEAFAAVYQRVAPEMPTFLMPSLDDAVEAYSAFLTRAEDGIGQAGGFGEPERWRHDWEREYTREAWLDMVPTSGGMSRLPAATLDALLAGLGDAVDAAGGRFTMRYAAVAVSVVRDSGDATVGK